MRKGQKIHELDFDNGSIYALKYNVKKLEDALGILPKYVTRLAGIIRDKN